MQIQLYVELDSKFKVQSNNIKKIKGSYCVSRDEDINMLCTGLKFFL